MTSVPKPLKFLRPHYSELKSLYLSQAKQAAAESNEYWKKDSLDKSLFAEILSVLAMTYSDGEERETLAFRIQAVQVAFKAGSDTKADEPGVWGHEYVRHLAAEIGEEYNSRVQRGEHGAAGDLPAPETNGHKEGEPQVITAGRATYQDLLDIAMLVVPFSLKHNAEADAVDLLLELEAIDKLVPHVDKDTFARVCLYMVSCVNLLVPPDDVQFLKTAHEIYRRNDRHTEALVLSLRLNDRELIRKDFEATQNPIMKKQLALLLGRQNVPIEWLTDEDTPLEDQDLVDCIMNTKLSENFIAFAKELNVYEPKSLEDIYKSHLENSTRSALSSTVDSARGNLASTFVNAFVNAGFGNDKLMVEAEEGDSWIYKNKDHGMLSAAASLGMSLLWDTEMGLSHIDKYTYSNDENVKAGALMAYGILHAGVRTEMDAALALLTEHVDSSSTPLKVSAIVGIGLAYAGSHREDIVPLLLQHVSDETTPMEIASLSALALGFVFVGSAHEEITPTILQTMMEREPAHLDDPWARFMSLGLALLFLGKQDQSDATIETLKAIEHPISLQTQVLVDMCSYAGTGNVLKIQTMLHHCLEHIDSAKEEEEGGAQEANRPAGPDAAAAVPDSDALQAPAPNATEGGNESSNKENEEDEGEKSDLHQAYAVLGVALLAMGEDVGAEMSLRHLSHLMHYGEPIIRKSVPLAIALLNPSNPAMPILDTLSKYSHDNDLDVAINAILAMGLVGAGTNNARLGQMLRQLAGYYYKEPDCLFMVRTAQGLVNMGKGLIGINPYHTDRSLMSPTAVAGILAVLVSFTDARECESLVS